MLKSLYRKILEYFEKRSKTLSIKTHIFNFNFYILITIIIFSVILLQSTYNIQKKYIITYQYELAEKISANISSYLNQIINLFDYISTYTGYYDFSYNYKLNILNNLIRHNLSIVSIIEVDEKRNAKVYYNYNDETNFNSIIPDSEMKKAYNNSFINYIKYISQPYKSDDNKYYIFLSVPVRDRSDNIKGIVIAKIDLMYLENYVKNYQTQKKIYIYIIDNKYNVISQNIPAYNDLLKYYDTNKLKYNLTKIENGNNYYRTLNNNFVFGTKTTIESLNLKILIETPVFEYIQSFIEMSIILLIIILFIILISLIFMRFLFKRISNPLTQLKIAAELIMQGHYNIKVNIISNDEFGILAKAFNAMITNLNKTISEIKSSEEKLKLALEAGKDGIWEWDIENNRITHSENWLKILGYEKDELYTLELWKSIIHPDDLQYVLAKVYSCLNNNEDSFIAEYRVKKQNNIYIWILDKGKVIKYAQDNRPVKMVGTITDIDKLKKIEIALRNSEKKFRELYSNMLDGLAESDLQGNIINFNKAFLDIIGYEASEIIYKNFRTITPEIYVEKEIRLIREQVYVRGYSDIFYKEFIRKDKRLVNVEMRYYAIKDDNNKINGIWAIVKDITDKVMAEKKIKQKSEELLRSNKELQEFAYIASHDLQEPLRTITGFINLLEKKYRDKLDEKGKSYIEYIVKGTERMKALINDLLSYARVNSRGQSFVLTDLNSILKEVLVYLQNKIKENNAKIKYEKLPSVYCDNNQIFQLFMNLIENAIKYKKDNESPEIIIGYTEKPNEYEFFVKDNGIGIEKEYFDRIFQIFQRLHPRHKYEGTGIGLSICKKIVERHKGNIWVESELNIGSTFYFTISKELNDIN